MNELNEAFDMLMSCLRTGDCGSSDGGFSSASEQHTGNSEQYRIIRQMINSGDVDNALARLNAIPNGARPMRSGTFLMGSAYYYKGWLDRRFLIFKLHAALLPATPNMLRHCGICKTVPTAVCPAILTGTNRPTAHRRFPARAVICAWP